jgi:hypothetical protein
MVKGSAKCPTCGQYVNLKEYDGHVVICTRENPQAVTTQFIDYNAMSHKEVLEYLIENPSEIEANLRIVDKEFFIGHARADLIGMDFDRKTCFIEVIHKSHYDEKYWEHKIREYANFALTLVGVITHESQGKWRTRIRLILFRPGKGIVKEIEMECREQIYQSITHS